MTDAEGEDATPDGADAADPPPDADRDSDPDPSFEIPARPRRRYPSGGGVEYEGETVFTLTPEQATDDETLTALVERVLADDSYTYGDWFDLPMPLYLVHDAATGDVFRVAVRDGGIEFHVLPATGAAGLRRLYDRLLAADADRSFEVDRRSTVD
jgi:hypothetical protein